jgi:hypothetical protein
VCRTSVTNPRTCVRLGLEDRPVFFLHSSLSYGCPIIHNHPSTGHSNGIRRRTLNLELGHGEVEVVLVERPKAYSRHTVIRIVSLISEAFARIWTCSGSPACFRRRAPTSMNAQAGAGRVRRRCAFRARPGLNPSSVFSVDYRMCLLVFRSNQTGIRCSRGAGFIVSPACPLD